MNHLKVVKELLAVTSTDPNKGRIIDSKTPLSVSSENGHIEVMEHLLNDSRVNANKGWVFDNWSIIEKEDTVIKNSSKDISGTSYQGRSFVNFRNLACNNFFPMLQISDARILQILVRTS